MFKKVIFNAGAQTLAKGISASTTLIVTLIIGKSLGPSGYGDFTKIFVFVGYFYTLADFGLNSIFIRESNEKNQSNLFRTLIGLRIVIALSLVFLAILISFLLPYNQEQQTGFSPTVKTGILIASLTILTHALFTTANGFFQKKLRYDYSAYATGLGSILILTATLTLSILKGSVLPFVVVFVLGGVGYVVASFFIIFRKYRQKIYPVFDKKKSQELLFLASPIGIALVLNLIYFRIDVLILSNFRPSAEVGIYGLAYQFFQAGLAIPIFFANSLFPLLASTFKTSVNEFKKQVKTWYILLSLFSVVLTVFLFLTSYIITFIFGNEFNGAPQALRILSLGIPFFFISALVWHLLIIENKQKTLIFIYATGAAFNILANFIFIPKFGFIAPSIITGISEALVLIMSLVALHSAKPFKLIKILK